MPKADTTVAPPQDGATQPDEDISVSLAATARFDVPGAAGPFRVALAWPEVPPPPQGYGAIYALDAGWTFGSLRDCLRLSRGVEAAAAVGPTLIVAIGYPTRDMVDLGRRADDLVGAGQGALRECLEGSILPRVEARFRVDPARRMILGHSYGGAFALRAGHAPGGSFSHVAAGSPSLWTAPDRIRAEMSAPSRAHPRTLITMGALEDATAAEAAGSDPARVARLRERDMMGRARGLAAQSGARFVVFAGADHGAAMPPFLTEAVRFLWQA